MLKHTIRAEMKTIHQLFHRDAAVVSIGCIEFNGEIDMVITTVPALIGSGRPLLGALSNDIDLKLIPSQSFPSGMVHA